MVSDIKKLPFVPSPFCVGEEHRRIEQCTDLIGNPRFRAVGVCRRCKTTKYYPHEESIMNNQISVQGQSSIRRY